MADILRANNAALLALEESTPGVFQALTASTDAIRVEAVALNPNVELEETNYVSGSIDREPGIVGGMPFGIEFSLWLKGAGVPGTAPEFRDLLRCCGLAETVTKTDITGTDISAAAANSRITSGTSIAAITVGTAVYLSGFANAANNGEFRVSAVNTGTMDLTALDGSAVTLVNESTGPSVTIRYGVVGTAATAGTTTGVTMQAPFAATADLYNGMPILVGGNPASPVVTYASDYTAARQLTLARLFSGALTTSSIVSVPANVRYVPATDNIIAVSLEVYIDGVRWRFNGVRGNVALELNARRGVRATFRLRGRYEGRADAAVPAVAYDLTRPGIWRGSAFTIDRAAAGLSRIGIDLGNEVEFPDNPNEVEGFDPPEITTRTKRATMDPNMTLIATRDIFGALRSGAASLIHAEVKGGLASNAGQRVALTMPAAIYQGWAPGRRGSIATEEVSFHAQGQDEGLYLTFR